MNQKNPSLFRRISIEIYVWAHILLGVAVVTWAILNWQPEHPLRFFSYLLSAVVASVLKVRLPGVTGTASVSFLFMLVGVVDLSLPEAIAIASLSMLTQSVWRTQRRPRPIQVAFSVASISAAVYISSLFYRSMLGSVPEPAALGALAVAFYFTNTFSVAGVIALSESLSLWDVSMHNRWLLPYYAGGTSLAWMIGTMPQAIQWEVPIICLPVVYLVHRSYRTHLVQMEQDKKHMEQVNQVHMRTIEALALAIDAKDHTTHDHLQRVQHYALEIGKELGLGPAELDALRAASVLHDIGKLAVPEHIISKPGKLTPAEFQKMKVHPVVGAEILERVSFPYPVTPMVRSHHEKWDGNGYPDGLAGVDIPIGARILAVVDCFDALASDRQYRRALPLDEAIARVVSEAGTSFDPAVVAVLQKRYRELELSAQALSAAAESVLSTDICITRGAAPAAGFATEPSGRVEDRASIDNLVRALASPPANAGLTLGEALSIVVMRAKAAVPHDAIAFFACEGDELRAIFTEGACMDGLAELEVPVGKGLAGWVAESGEPIVNGNPQVEHGYTAPSDAALESALAIPLQGHKSLLGVLAVYRREKDAFSASEATALASLCRPLAHVLESARPTPETAHAA
ncbi:MAG: HD domain-containing phosphohydrolase [Bryobacteraceae bacterium]